MLPVFLYVFLGAFSGLRGYFSEEKQPQESIIQKPTVVLAIIARNAAHSLPFYLGAIERLDYPKDRISVWAATDHNIDNTTAILREWLTVMQIYYHNVEWRPMDQPTSYPGEMGPKHWTNSRYEYLMKLKQAALNYAKKQWADYIMYVDTDNILTNPQTLSLMIAENKSVMAPMLDSQTAYSNYWCGITPQGYYRRTAEYFPTRHRHRRGCYPVPMVHSTFLLDLRKEGVKKLAFHPPHPDYSWPFDDIIAFAFSCRVSGVQMYLCNKQRYGYLNVPAKPHQTNEDDRGNFVHLQLEAMIDGPPMYPSEHVFLPPRHPDKMGFDEVYLINLRRRPDRRDRMVRSLYEQDIDVKVMDAVDGGALNSSDIKQLGVDLLPGYYDPFSGRTLTKGEVGCFLSHYSIWKEMVDLQLERAVVFEDDVRFQGNFKKRLLRLMEEIDLVELDWDLIYLGRKEVNPTKEQPVENVRNLVEAGYSYWTLSYVISLQGATKLLNAEPLSKMVPIDEFLPLMYDKHPKYQHKCDELEVREKDFSSELERLTKDKKEIVSFLKRSLDQRADELADLTDRLIGLQQAKDAEKEACENQLAQLRHEFQESKDQLTSENMILAGKLASVEEFRVQKEELMGRLTRMEEQLEKQGQEHQTTISNLEKKAVVDRDRLKKEMMVRVAAVAAEFRRVSDKQMAETTKRMIRENVSVTAQLSKSSSKSLELLQENQALKELEERQRQQLGVLEHGQKDLARRSLSNQKVVRILTEKCKEQQYVLQEYMEKEHEYDQLKSDHATLQQEVQVLRQELASRKDEQRVKHAEAEDLKRCLIAERQSRGQLERILKEAAFALKEALLEAPSAMKEADPEIQTHVRRRQMMEKLLSLLDSAALLGVGPALKEFKKETVSLHEHRTEPGSDSLSPLLKVPRLLPHYRIGDLGLVPRPEQTLSTTLSKAAPLSRSTQLELHKHLGQDSVASGTTAGRAAALLPEITAE
ncbi:procollagen galactosyltransferase 2 isoform X1 [Polyodon spathula]|uniref:procollagen galactosyltransferase 2 isoform X1 n=1 Tax=Polyodon spathula TaxID=7913 RepID=UPI001B7F3262|nr:procollagen galactosyltransferase 2 isoform X1 [Polyodon spathula]